MSWWAHHLSPSQIEGLRVREAYLFHCDFSSCWFFCTKKCSFVFYSGRQKSMDKNCAKIPPPPPSHLSLSPNNVGFRSLRTKTPCVCVLTPFPPFEGGGGWGGGIGVCGLSRSCLKPCFPACGKKHWDIFNTKIVSMANFSGFQATWKIATK